MYMQKQINTETSMQKQTVDAVDFLTWRNRLTSLEEENKLKRMQLRYGLTADVTFIKTETFPLYVGIVLDAETRKDEKFLREEMSIHGIEDMELRISQMVYILLKIAGVKRDEFVQVFTINESNFVAKILNETMKKINEARRKRNVFMLEHPELDHRKERIGTRSLQSLSQMLEIIKTETGLNADEVFDVVYIPKYIPRRNVIHFKSHENRSLKAVLDEVVLALTNPNWKEIQRLSNRTKGDILTSMTNSISGNRAEPYKFFSEKLIKAFCEKRIAFQQSSKARLYPLDGVKYKDVLEKLERMENIV